MNTIICPGCGKVIEISKALLHEEREKIKKEAEEKASQKIKEESEFKLKDYQNQLDEAKNKNRDLHDQLLELNKSIREIKELNDKRELENQKKLNEELEKSREQISKIEQEKANLEKMELQKQLDDTKKLLEEAQRKSNQKSQQMQGEVLELDLENMLKSSFSQDEIRPVGKGVSGADIRQIVKSPRGRVCGVILWESKRTKEWRDVWISKLKEDLRSEKANIPVIVSSELPKEAKDGFGQKDGVIICSHALALPIATVLRKNLLDVEYQKVVSENRGDKAELLYAYITSHEFRQQVENIMEVHNEIQEQIIKERVSFEKFWKQREAQAQRIIISTANIVGSMQGKIGASALQIKGLELPEIESGEDNEGDKT